MENKFILLLLAFFPLFSSGQTGKFYAGLTASKEFDMMNLNQPIGVQSVIRLWPIYIQAEYKFDNARTTPFQVTQSTESYGGRFGVFFDNKKSSGLSGIGLHAGILKRNEYKKIIFTQEEYPVDALGNTVEVDKVQVLTNSSTYVLGFTVFQLVVDNGEKLKALMDDYDIQLLKKRKRYNTLLLTFEAMFQPKTEYSNSISYNPYNFYISREIFFKPEFKHQKFGVNLRLDYTGPLHVGLFTQMGVLPGITHKSDDYLDFNFMVRAGANINVGFFKKKDE